VTPDHELVTRCLRGDPAAARGLVERFQSDVFGLCVRLLRNRHDAEDVAQEVFLRVFRSLRRWDPARPFKPWVLGIAVNRCRTAMAKRVKRPDPADYLADLPDLTPPAGDRELHDAVTACVAELRDEYREVFVLFHETGRSYEEIAEVVARPVGTVKTWLHRARLIVQDRLRQRGLMPADPETVDTQAVPPHPQPT
jgi:RNA polymerase sigma-70 factor (ECF subfamily)